jgi:hypothetical protein
MTLGYAVSTQLRGVFQISPGNVVKPTGIVSGSGAGAYFGKRGFAVSAPEWPCRRGDVEEMHG